MPQEMIKDAKNAVNKEVSNAKVRLADSPISDDIDAIREDVRVLAADAKVLGRDLKSEGRKQMEYAGERAKEALETAREQGKDQLADALAFVRNNPGQSVAIAFVGGMVASLLLGRR